MIKRLITTVLACGLVTSATAASYDNDILEKYAKHSQFLSIKISPEGNYLAATSRDEDGTIFLSVLDIDNQQLISRTQGRGNESVGSFYWANEERLLMTMAREVGSFDMPFGTGEIIGMDVDGGNQKILAGPRSDDKEYRIATIIDMLPEEPDQVMIQSVRARSKQPFIELYRMKVSSGRKSPAGRIPLRRYSGTGVGVILDQNGVARMAVGTDPEANNEAVMMVRGGEDQEWVEVKRFNPDEGSFSPLLILPDNKHAVVLSDLETDTQSVGILDLSTFETEILASHPKTDITPVMGIKNGRENEVLGASYEYDSIEGVIFADIENKLFAQIIQSLQKAFPNTNVDVTSSTYDMSKIIISVSSANVPRTFFLFDSEKRKLTKLVDSTPWLDKKTMPKTQIITYHTRDGLLIHGLLTLPANKEAKNLPLILLPHGGPHGIRDSISRIDADAKVLAEHGYAVLQPNFRGSGGYGREFLQMGYQNWGTTMINDMTDGVMYLVDKGIADKDNMCVYGASYGGYAALMTVIREPDLYQCTIGFVGVYDLNLMFEEGDISERKAGQNFLSKVLPADKALREAQSPVHQIDKLKVPVFIMQGGKDVRVPPEHAYRLRAALDKRNHPYEWLFKEGEGHGFYKPENNVERWQKMLTFLDKYIEH